MMMSGLELIQQYEQKKAGFDRKMRDLRVELNMIEIELDDQRIATIAALNPHVKAQQSIVEAKRAAFWVELNKATMEDSFVSKYQMRAAAAWSNQLPAAQDAMSVVSNEDGAAAVAYCLTGKLDAKAISVVMPARSQGHSAGIPTVAPHDQLLTHPARRREIEAMCKTLGVCSAELSELAHHEAVLNTLTDFQ